MEFCGIWKNKENDSLNGRIEFPVDLVLKAGVRYTLWLNSNVKKTDEKAPDYIAILTKSKIQ